MGTHVVILLPHSDFPRIIDDPEFGDKLYHSGVWDKGSNGFKFLGEADADKSFAVLHYDGLVWCPSLKEHRKTKDLYNDQSPEMFTVITVSGDLALMMKGMKKVGKHTVSAIKSFKRNTEHHPVYVSPYAQAIQIVETFSSSDVGMSVIEGNTSWLVGREETPSWARAAKIDHSDVREVLELTLALRQGVKVNLTSTGIQKLILARF